jgi:hypothetical protein
LRNALADTKISIRAREVATAFELRKEFVKGELSCYDHADMVEHLKLMATKRRKHAQLDSHWN